MKQETRTLVLVWAVLLLLLAATITASYAPLGDLKPVANISIALIKAGLIFWFFMHLKDEPGLVRLTALGGAAWLVIMLVRISSDYVTRG